MIRMGMGYEKVVYVLTPHSCPLQLGQDSVTTSCINKQHPFLAMKREASVVASCNKRIACAEHGDIISIFFHELMQIYLSIGVYSILASSFFMAHLSDEVQGLPRFELWIGGVAVGMDFRLQR